MTLKEKLMTLSSIESNWGIWADAPFSDSSETRIGQLQFENGGLLDDKEFVGTLESLTVQIEADIDDPTCEYEREVAVENLISDLEDKRKELNEVLS